MRAAIERAALRAVAWASICALGLVSFAARAAAPSPDIDALVSYETRQVMASGVTRVDSWQERLVRRGNQVWTERVLPPASATGHERESEAEHLGHKHFNGETAAHWLTLGVDGKVEVKYVDREHKAVVSIPRAEFGTVGFDGSFDAAASIVPESIAMAMKPVARGAATNGALWRTDRSNGWSHRVLWSTANRLAMKVESQRDDGSVRRVVSVQIQPSRNAQAAPWGQLGDYVQKRYDDFMD